MLITYSYSLLDKMDGKYVVDIMFQSILGLQFIIALQKFWCRRNILFMVQKKHPKYHDYAQRGEKHNHLYIIYHLRINQVCFYSVLLHSILLNAHLQ
jgi:hypothetical protein